MTLSRGRTILLANTDEPTFQRWVMEYAHVKGWLVSAMHDSRSLWWNADAGFPDLVLARDGRVVIAELKTMRGKLRPEQQRWGVALMGKTEYYCWRPSDEQEIVRILA